MEAHMITHLLRPRNFIVKRITMFLSCTMLLVTSSAFSYTWPTYIFSDQFERGDFYSWSWREIKEPSKIELDSVVSYSGKYSACATIPALNERRIAYLKKNYKETNSIYIRSYVYLKKINMNTNHHIDFFNIAKTGTGTVQALRLKKEAENKYYLATKNAGKGKAFLSPEKWYCIEVQYSANGTNGTYKVFVDGKEDISSSNLTLVEGINELRLGWIAMYESSSSDISGSINFDDVFIDEYHLRSSAKTITIIHPNFTGRIGAKAIAVLNNFSSNDQLSIDLFGSNGYSKNILKKSNNIKGREEVQVNLSGLSKAIYTFSVTLSDSKGNEKAKDTVMFDKNYEGDPFVTIDVDNNVLINKKKFFPVSPFGLNRAHLKNWAENKYINILYGQDWGTPTKERFVEYLDSAFKYDLYCFGPMNTGCKKADGPNPWTDAVTSSYVEHAKHHKRVAWWSFREEPIFNRYKAEDYYSWWKIAQKKDPSRFTNMIAMGLYFHSPTNEFLTEKVHKWMYPYLVADMYGFDVYPIEYDVGFEEMALAADNVNKWNYRLLPTTAFVQTADCLPGRGGGTPKPEEVTLMCWLMVVHGIKGIHWYHYQGTTPPKNFAAMRTFVKDIKNLTHGILGDSPKLKISHKELDGGRVDIMAKEHNDTTFLFAANIKEKTEKVEFTFESLYKNAKIEVYGENSRNIVLSGKTFTDQLKPLGVGIYKIYNDAVIPIKNPIKEGGRVYLKTIHRNGKLTFLIKPSKKNKVSLNIYNTQGKKIWNYNSIQPSFNHTIQWDFKENVIPSGQYIVTIDNTYERYQPTKICILN